MESGFEEEIGNIEGSRRGSLFAWNSTSVSTSVSTVLTMLLSYENADSLGLR